MKPQIKLLKLCTGHYFYDVGRNQIVKVSEQEYNEMLILRKIGFEEYNKMLSANNQKSILDKYVNKGFLSAKKPDRIIHPYTYIVEDVLSSQLHTAILQITQMCNLRCRYCPYSGNGYLDRKHINKSMSFETAKKVIDFILLNGRQEDYINIGFYGGEPTIKLGLIKEIVEYTKKNAEGKDLYFFMTTNATLIDRDAISFLAANDFSITISLDGPQNIHDKNRRKVVNGNGSFNDVYSTLNIIANEFPNLINKVGINAVWDMEESYNDVVTYFKTDPVLSQFDYSISPVDNFIIDTKFSMVNSNYYEQQINQFFSMLGESGIINIPDSHHDTSTLKLFDDFKDSLYPQKEVPDECHPGGMCIPGYSRLFVDADGNFFPCEKVSENSKMALIGNVYDGFNYKQIRRIMNIGTLNADDCKQCWCRQFCTCCFKFVDDMDELSLAKKRNECKQIIKSTLKIMKEYILLKEAKKSII